MILSLGEKTAETRIEDCRRQHGRWVLQLESLRSIPDAEAWIGASVSIPKTDLPDAEEGAYFSFDLEGCAVYSGGRSVGSLRRLLDYGGSALLEVEQDGREVLIPFAKAYLKSVDIRGKRIDMELPEGLIDLNG